MQDVLVLAAFVASLYLLGQAFELLRLLAVDVHVVHRGTWY